MNKFDKFKKYKLDTLAIGMCILVTVSTIISYSADFKINSSIAYVDIDELLKIINTKDEKKEAANKTPDPKLSAVLEEIATERHIIIFPRSSIIAGGIDITDDVKKLLKVDKDSDI